MNAFEMEIEDVHLSLVHRSPCRCSLCAHGLLAHETSAVATEESPVRILDALPELDARTPAQLLKSANI
jgi:hypothetical protein